MSLSMQLSLLDFDCNETLKVLAVRQTYIQNEQSKHATFCAEGFGKCQTRVERHQHCTSPTRATGRKSDSNYVYSVNQQSIEVLTITTTSADQVKLVQEQEGRLTWQWQLPVGVLPYLQTNLTPTNMISSYLPTEVTITHYERPGQTWKAKPSRCLSQTHPTVKSHHQTCQSLGRFGPGHGEA